MTSIETATGDWNNELQDIGFDNVTADAGMLGDDELSLEADDGVVGPSTDKRKAADANDADGEDDVAAPDAAAKKPKTPRNPRRLPRRRPSPLPRT